MRVPVHNVLILIQVSGSLPSPRSVPAQPALEKEWTLTKAKAGQKTGAAFLGAVNLVGVAILQSILTSRNVALAIYHGTEVGAYALWIGRLMPFLQVGIHACICVTNSQPMLCRACIHGAFFYV